MHDGGETTTTGRDGMDTGGIKGIKKISDIECKDYKNNVHRNTAAQK